MPDRQARVADVHKIALSMPHVKRIEGPKGNPIYQVGGKSFVFFRTPQPDAEDHDTGERYADVIMIWVESESDKLSLIQDRDSPFFTTDRFDGHPSVLVRAKDLHRIARSELTELIQDAWLSRASKRRADLWLAEHGG
ncbi:MAG: MmcQ/YjbR family DNA-binding protein [Mycobacterium sp.]|uniref:MmcQ/YjbR family DNA-binding protein n=1 Tax=Mycobacterium sp. TaxID=1785 RepID=UPI00389996F8